MSYKIKVGIEFELIATDDEKYMNVVNTFKASLHAAIRHNDLQSIQWINDRCQGMDQIKGIKLS